MDNFNDFEQKKYEPADKKIYSFCDHIRLLFKFIIICFQVISRLVVDIVIRLLTILIPRKPKDISGQIALVTGGANGLGRAIAFRIAQEKCNVVIADLNLPEAEKTANEISKKFNVRTSAHKVDVSNCAQILELRNTIESTMMGTVDILVNNAGILSRISLLEGQPSDLQKVIDVNLTSHFWTLRTFLERMIEKKRGHIVAISSMSGKMSVPLACVYTATKFGVRGLMNALYDELCVDNDDEFIKTTTAYPAFISTRKELSDILDQVDEIGPRMTPEFVANGIVSAMLLDEFEVHLPYSAHVVSFLIGLLPQKVMRYAKKKMAPVSHLRLKTIS